MTQPTGWLLSLALLAAAAAPVAGAGAPVAGTAAPVAGAAAPVAGAAAAGVSCESLRPGTWAPPQGAEDPAGDVRVFAIQFKQEIRHVTTYESFFRKMDCLMQEHVAPFMRLDAEGTPEIPHIVVFNEDIGLATLGTGTRGLPARLIAEHGPKDPEELTGAIAAFGSLATTYAPAIGWYGTQYPDTSPQRLILAAATDMFVRGFMRTFSTLARDYGVYVVSSNIQAGAFRETSDPAAIATLADPDLAAAYATGTAGTVYEALPVGTCDPAAGGRGCGGVEIFNQAWMWAPLPEGEVSDYARETYAGFGPDGAAVVAPDDPRANIINGTKKTPLTGIEQDFLDLTDDRDMSQANTGPFCLLPADDPGCEIRIGYGISLPGFQWGTAFGVPYAGDPCGGPGTWMRCLDARGTTLFLQPEANPAMWAEYIDVGLSPPAFQALSWLRSAWRSVADPTVANIRYAVTPHLVGNLVDVTFDGQSVIFERCLSRSGGGDTCDGNTPATFIGAREFLDCGVLGMSERCDDSRLEIYHGLLRETVVLAQWVLDDDPTLDPVANRERLAERSRAMQAGSGSPDENNYLETAVWADLDFSPPP